MKRLILALSFFPSFMFAGPVTGGGGGSAPISSLGALGTVGGGGYSAPVVLSEIEMNDLLEAFNHHSTIYFQDTEDQVLPVGVRSIDNLYEVDAIDSNGNRIRFIESDR